MPMRLSLSLTPLVVPASASLRLQCHRRHRLPRGAESEEEEEQPARPLRRPRDEAVSNLGRDGGGIEGEFGDRRPRMRAEDAVRNGAGG